MQYDNFLESVSKIANIPLPGEDSHYKMAPPIRRIKELKWDEILAKNPKKSAVMSLFYPDENKQARLLLILRKSYKGVHSNQVGFPGGKFEKEDTSLLHTALRETEEEVGILPHNVKVICPLSEIYIPPSNFLVQPYVGVLQTMPTFVKQESEVEMLIEVKVKDLLNDSLVFEQVLTTSYVQNMRVPAFKLNGYTVWGATAMMLSEVKELLKQVL
jgi:8-oxo-dGTP pyrophosphatase MutT (NUDIX family)